MKDSAYKKAGVDIEAGAALVERIKPHIKKTNRSGVVSGIGGFGAMFDLMKTGFKDPILVSSTDGVGTKIKIAIETNSHDTIGIDAVAMCVNDIIVQGAEPLFFLDYFATGRLENDVAEKVIAGIAEGCAEAGCALIGGETAEMPGMYAAKDYDIAGFTVGAVERDQIINGENIKAGDVVLGLASSGLHSNGFSLVRHLVEQNGYSYQAPAPYDPSNSLGKALLTPTRIYVRQLMKALTVKDSEGNMAVRGMAHITGGGLYENIPRILPKTVKSVIDAKAWDLPPVFSWLKSIGGLENRDMARTLNCGIGMVVVCHPDSVKKITDILKKAGEQVFNLGYIAKRAKSDAAIEISNIENAWT